MLKDSERIGHLLRPRDAMSKIIPLIRYFSGNVFAWPLVPLK